MQEWLRQSQLPEQNHQYCLFNGGLQQGGQNIQWRPAQDLRWCSYGPWLHWTGSILIVMLNCDTLYSILYNVFFPTCQILICYFGAFTESQREIYVVYLKKDDRVQSVWRCGIREKVIWSWLYLYIKFISTIKVLWCPLCLLLMQNILQKNCCI